MFKKKKKEDMVEISVNELNTILEKANKIYNENYKILYDFCLKEYNITKKEIHSFRLRYDNSFSMRICDLIKEKHYFNNEIKNDIYISNKTNVINAYNNLKELFKVLKEMKLYYNDKYFNLIIRPARVEKMYDSVWYSKEDINYESIIDFDYLEFTDPYLVLKTAIGKNVKIENYEDYDNLKKYINYYENEITDNLFFTKDGKLKSSLRNISLEDYDLKKVNFDGKNISGIDITHNPETNINFDKIIKDLSDANVSGYNLNKYKFTGWNLSNTNLKNTYAAIDLLSCIVTTEGKVSQGTQFDENNTFFIGEKELSIEQVEDLGIKVYRKGK